MLRWNLKPSEKKAWELVVGIDQSSGFAQNFQILAIDYVAHFQFEELM